MSIKKFLFVMLAMFAFTACSQAKDNTNDVKAVEEDSISNNTAKKEVLFSNQKENERKRDIETSFNISIDTDKYDNKELTEKQKAIIDCEPVSDGDNKIVGMVDGKCKIEAVIDNKKVVCNFEPDDLPTVARFYGADDDDTNFLKMLGGKYNIDFKMDIPEFNVEKNEDDDDTSFNFKFGLPKLKIERNKSPVEVIIEKSCK